jgi:hypothetical protein
MHRLVDHASYHRRPGENSSRRDFRIAAVSLDMDARSSGRVGIVLGADADPAAVPAWCEQVRSLLRQAPGAVVECDAERLSGTATDVVEALARLRLVALRCGGDLRLRRASPDLLAVLELLGFTDLLPAADND